MNLEPVVDLGKKIVIDVESHILCRSTARKSLHLGEELMTEVKVFTFTSIDVCKVSLQFYCEAHRAFWFDLWMITLGKGISGTGRSRKAQSGSQPSFTSNTSSLSCGTVAFTFSELEKC